MAAPNMHARVSGVWKRIVGVHVRAGGAWKKVKRVWVRQGGAWKKAHELKWVYTLNVSNNRGAIRLDRAAMAAAGWDTVMPVDLRLSITGGAVVGSSRDGASNEYYAPICCGSTNQSGAFPAGSVCSITIASGARLAGEGGAGAANRFAQGSPGGAGLEVHLSTGIVFSVTNNGTIAGGGGGGGAGYQSTFEAGGGGGAGSPGGSATGAGSPGVGTLTSGGAGGTNYTAVGGAGGGPGDAGTGGDYTLGGAGGPAVIGNSKINWIATGTRLGAIT